MKQENDIQSALVSLRNTIRDAIPEAEETIAWSTPTWKKNGTVIRFAVSKNHIGVYVAEEAISFFEDRLMGFETYKVFFSMRNRKRCHCIMNCKKEYWQKYGM